MFAQAFSKSVLHCEQCWDKKRSFLKSLGGKELIFYTLFADTVNTFMFLLVLGVNPYILVVMSEVRRICKI